MNGKVFCQHHAVFDGITSVRVNGMASLSQNCEVILAHETRFPWTKQWCIYKEVPCEIFLFVKSVKYSIYCSSCTDLPCAWPNDSTGAEPIGSRSTETIRHPMRPLSCLSCLFLLVPEFYFISNAIPSTQDKEKDRSKKRKMLLM